MLKIKRKIKIKIANKLFLGCLVVLGLTSCQTTSPQEEAMKKKSVDANINLGMANLKKNNTQLAKQKFLAALSMNPKYPPAWYSLGYYYEVTGDENTADQYYLQALKLAPNSGDTNNNYGTFLCQNGHYQQAINRFLIAIKDPDYLDAPAAYENAGLCALSIPDLSLAKLYFGKAIQEDPSRSVSLMDLAAISYKEGNYVLANNYIEQFFSNNEPTAGVLLLAMETAMRLKRYSDAESYRMDLEQMFPGSKEAARAKTL